MERVHYLKVKLAISIIIYAVSNHPLNLICQPSRDLKTTLPIQKVVVQQSELNPTDEIHIFKDDEMKELWRKFEKDPAWVSLSKIVNKAGFSLKMGGKQWGGKGNVKIPDENGNLEKNAKKQDVLFCVYDLEVNSKGETCSMLWVKKDAEFYKACIITPKGKSIIEGVEWYAEPDGTIKKANSWRKCFLNNITKICGKFCLTGMAGCAPLVTTAAGYVACVASICGGCEFIDGAV